MVPAHCGTKSCTARWSRALHLTRRSTWSARFTMPLSTSTPAPPRAAPRTGPRSRSHSQAVADTAELVELVDHAHEVPALTGVPSDRERAAATPTYGCCPQRRAYGAYGDDEDCR